MFDFWGEYQRKLRTPEEAVSVVKSGDWVEFPLSAAIPRKIDRFVQTWRWKAAQVNGGTPAEFDADTTGPHTIYTTVADPKLPWTPNGTGTNQIWTSTLDFVYDNIPAARVLVDVPERTRDVMAAITSHLFSNMGFVYDKDGKPKYGGYYDDEDSHQAVPYNLTGFLAASTRYVNCSDMALGVATLGGLAGARVSVCRTYPFGYVNTVNLIGIGECNNPMYESDDDIRYWVNVTNELTGAVERIERQGTALPLAVCPPDETRRSYFASHLYVVDAGGNVHDACVGPELGTRGITPYLRAVIDYSTPNEADRGNYHTDPARAGTTGDMNKNFLLK